MSSSLLKDLIMIPQFEGVEYVVDQSPPEYRNFIQQGNYIYLLLDNIPSADLSVYVYPYKRHIVQESLGTSDTAGAVKTAGSAGDTTLALKSLDTGTINENTVLTITDDDTDYIVQATATIGTNEATVTIHPPLQADVDADTVVTLSLLNTFSLTNAGLEDVFCNYLAGEAAVNKGASIIQETEEARANLDSGEANIGEVGTEASQYLNYAKVRASVSGAKSMEVWGLNKKALAERELRGMAVGSSYQVYSRS
jgi:hypothetical protein